MENINKPSHLSDHELLNQKDGVNSRVADSY